jgi:hypothetical protein
VEALAARVVAARRRPLWPFGHGYRAFDGDIGNDKMSVRTRPSKGATHDHA